MDTNIVAEGMAPGPDGTLLRFFYDPVRNEQASIAEGRAIFDTALFVDVITPGQKASTPRFEVERIWSEQSLKALNLTEPTMRSYKYDEYVEQIEKYKRMEGDDFGGTPLKLWPRIDRGLAATLAAVHIHTVEALAAVTDGNLANLGLGGRELREQAKTFLAAAEGSAEASKLTERVTAAEREQRRLQEALEAANIRNAELEKALGEKSSKAKALDLTFPKG